MLKIFFVAILLAPGMTQPFAHREPVDTYAACLAEVARIQAQIVELNARGEEFQISIGCEFQSEKSTPA